MSFFVDVDATDYELARDAVLEAFNPPDDDVAEVAIVIEAVERAAAYIARQPCTCCDDPTHHNREPEYWHEPCARCHALGRYHDEAIER